MRGLARDVRETLAWMARIPEAWVAVAIVSMMLVGCAVFENPTAEAAHDLSSPAMTNRLCAASADTAACRK